MGLLVIPVWLVGGDERMRMYLVQHDQCWTPETTARFYVQEYSGVVENIGEVEPLQTTVVV